MQIDPVVRVISLHDAAARRAAFASLNGHVQFSFVNAVLGRALGENVRNDPALFTPDLGYSDGCVGNALSHILQWDHCIKTATAVTVAEDDSIFRHDFTAMQARVLAGMGEDWDIIYWGYNFDALLHLKLLPGISPTILTLDQNALRAHMDTFVASSSVPFVLPLQASCGLPSFSVSPRGAAQLMAGCLPLSSISKHSGQPFFNYGLDHAMGSVCPYINAFACVPPLVASKNHKHDSSANRVSTDVPASNAG